MHEKDLFIILKAILWYLPTSPLPSDSEIIKFIRINKEINYDRIKSTKKEK